MKKTAVCLIALLLSVTACRPEAVEPSQTASATLTPIETNAPLSAVSVLPTDPPQEITLTLAPTETPAPEETVSPVPTTEPPAIESPAIRIEQTGWTRSVPSSYASVSSRPGTVVPLTYDARDYARDGAPIRKTAYVYLPYGYDEDPETRYDVIYFVNGWGGHAGEYFEFKYLKTLFDRLIEKGDAVPMIIVSACFYNDNSRRDFDGSVDELRAFHDEFRNDLMPAVESEFRTFAASASDGDLKASRDHRAFGGFSFGGVTTWLEFCYDSDYIRWYLPMSGGCWYYGTYGDFRFAENVDFLERLVSENDLDARGYFIYHAVGTDDEYQRMSVGMAEEMLSRNSFSAEHYVFYKKRGGVHNYRAVQEYLYNALPLFFRGVG